MTTSTDAPDLWYNYLMLNDLEYRYEPSSIIPAADAGAGAEPNRNYFSINDLYSKNPSSDGSIFLKGARLFNDNVRSLVLDDLDNLESYIFGLNIDKDPTSSTYGCLFYDSLAQSIQQPTRTLEPNYFDTGDGSTWGMFVSGADEYNRNLHNEGRSSLFSIISPMPVVYDTDINAEPEYKFYIPEFNLQGSFLKDFIEPSSEPLPYSGFPQNGEPENGAFTLRPDNFPLTEPATNGYFLNNYFVGALATNGGWAPFYNLYARILQGDPTLAIAKQGNWSQSILDEISKFKSTITSYGASNSEQIINNPRVANQYPFYTDSTGATPIKGYFTIPSTSFQANNGTNIYIHDSSANITVRNTNPYLNLLYLKVDLGSSPPTWWSSNTNVPNGIPIYQGEPENSPIPFQRNNLFYPPGGQFTPPPTTDLFPVGGGVWCFSNVIQDSTAPDWRLLMIFGHSDSYPTQNDTTLIIPGGTEPSGSWPVSIGPFELNLATSVGQSNWNSAFNGADFNISLLDEPEGNDYCFGLNYLDMNGAYLQTPLVGDTYILNAKKPDNSDIDPCGQKPYKYYEPSSFTYSGTKAPIDWTKGFDCGLGKPLYGLNNSVGGVGGYGYGNLNEDKKQTQDLNSINIIPGDPDPL
jgi:hypothetical protein